MTARRACYLEPSIPLGLAGLWTPVDACQVRPTEGRAGAREGRETSAGCWDLTLRSSEQSEELNYDLGPRVIEDRIL